MWMWPGLFSEPMPRRSGQHRPLLAPRRRIPSGPTSRAYALPSGKPTHTTRSTHRHHNHRPPLGACSRTASSVLFGKFSSPVGSAVVPRSVEYISSAICCSILCEFGFICMHFGQCTAHRCRFGHLSQTQAGSPQHTCGESGAYCQPSLFQTTCVRFRLLECACVKHCVSTDCPVKAPKSLQVMIVFIIVFVCSMALSLKVGSAPASPGPAPPAPASPSPGRTPVLSPPDCPFAPALSGPPSPGRSPTGSPVQSPRGSPMLSPALPTAGPAPSTPSPVRTHADGAEGPEPSPAAVTPPDIGIAAALPSAAAPAVTATPQPPPPALPPPPPSRPPGAFGCRSIALGITDVELARSSRSFCRVCGCRISKGDPRFMYRHAKNRPATFLHPECVVGLARTDVGEQLRALAGTVADASLRLVVVGAWAASLCC